MSGQATAGQGAAAARRADMLLRTSFLSRRAPRWHSSCISGYSSCTGRTGEGGTLGGVSHKTVDDCVSERGSRESYGSDRSSQARGSSVKEHLVSQANMVPK
jgi:hypothetical protein